MLQHSPPRGNALRSAPSPPQEGEEENTPPELSNAANVRHSPPRKEPNAAVASAAAGVSLAAVREATAGHRQLSMDGIRHGRSGRLRWAGRGGA